MTEGAHTGEAALRRRNRTMGLLIGGVAVLAATGLGVGIWAATSGPDRDDSGSLTAAFVERYATGDPAACEYATPELASQLGEDGRCAGSAHGQTPKVDVLFAKDCGSKSLAGVEVNPAGEVGKRYALVGLVRGDAGWSARSIQPLSDRAAVQPGECTTGTSYGG